MFSDPVERATVEHAIDHGHKVFMAQSPPHWRTQILSIAEQKGVMVFVKLGRQTCPIDRADPINVRRKY